MQEPAPGLSTAAITVITTLANRKLARALADQGFGAARRMLSYKTVREGGRLLVADRWYPSSKRCSGCGSVKAKLTLAERVYQCDACGLVLDRDVNAARTRHRERWSDRDRRPPGGCGMSAIERYI
jgi:transposase